MSDLGHPLVHSGRVAVSAYLDRGRPAHICLSPTLGPPRTIGLPLDLCLPPAVGLPLTVGPPLNVGLPPTRPAPHRRPAAHRLADPARRPGPPLSIGKTPRVGMPRSLRLTPPVGVPRPVAGRFPSTCLCLHAAFARRLPLTCRRAPAGCSTLVRWLTRACWSSPADRRTPVGRSSPAGRTAPAHRLAYARLRPAPVSPCPSVGQPRLAGHHADRLLAVGLPLALGLPLPTGLPRPPVYAPDSRPDRVCRRVGLPPRAIWRRPFSPFPPVGLHLPPLVSPSTRWLSSRAFPTQRVSAP